MELSNKSIFHINSQVPKNQHSLYDFEVFLPLSVLYYRYAEIYGFQQKYDSTAHSAFMDTLSTSSKEYVFWCQGSAFEYFGNNTDLLKPIIQNIVVKDSIFCTWKFVYSVRPKNILKKGTVKWSLNVYACWFNFYENWSHISTGTSQCGQDLIDEWYFMKAKCYMLIIL